MSGGGDFSVTLSERDGVRVWVAHCYVCGDSFDHMTWEQEIICPLEDHVHIQEPNLPVILALSGQPGASSDNILRAMGVPDDMLSKSSGGALPSDTQMGHDERVSKDREDAVDAFEILNRWRKFDVSGDDTEVHLREVVIGGDTFVELRDYFPDRDRYGTGYLIGQLPLTSDLESLVDHLRSFRRD